eukprot:gb/GFBE01040406.1/.p1 GENE.gb/GFBE01040406.1/~~gb/GFBE01040406.1/.p1  ORF type:complete len:102 (+),score=18.27 gb/GFBE01040406.1/:1-306(+)
MWRMDATTPGEDWEKVWANDHAGRVVALANGGADSVVSAALDGTVRVWEADSGEGIFGIPEHKVWLGSVCLSEDKGLMLTDGRDNAVYLYNFREDADADED